MDGRCERLVLRRVVCEGASVESMDLRDWKGERGQT